MAATAMMGFGSQVMEMGVGGGEDRDEAQDVEVGLARREGGAGSDQPVTLGVVPKPCW
jgi:hypothetical protein